VGTGIPRIGYQTIDGPHLNAAYDFQVVHEFSFVKEVSSPADRKAHDVRSFVRKLALLLTTKRSKAAAGIQGGGFGENSAKGDGPDFKGWVEGANWPEF
jgi:hypothetical protein